jgi:hypothetical protein
MPPKSLQDFAIVLVTSLKGIDSQLVVSVHYKRKGATWICH